MLEVDQAARTRLRQQEVVVELGQQALETDDLEQSMRDASNAVAEALDSDCVKVRELVPGDGATLRRRVRTEIEAERAFPLGARSSVMATIAEFSVPTESFALAETLPEFPDVAVEVDRIAAHVPDTTMPCVWAADGGTAGFSEAVATDATVKEIQATAEFDGERLYHIEWSDEIDDLVAKMIDHEGVILEALGRADRWRLRIRFMTRKQFQAFQTYFTEHGPAFRLEQLFDAKHPRHTRGDVSPDQHEALTTAADLGYFEVPRESSLQEVADELDISHQATSELIRRGSENLVRDMLTAEPIRDGA